MYLFKIISFHILVFLVPTLGIAGLIYNGINTEVQARYMDRVNSLAAIQESRVEELLADYKRELLHLTTYRMNAVVLENYKRTPSSDNLLLLNRALQDMRYSGGYRHTYALTQTGIVVASTDSTAVGTDMSTKEFFANAKTEPVVHRLFKDAFGKIYTSLAGPLVLDNLFVGVLVVERPVDDLFGLFHDHLGLGLSGEWGLASRTASGDALMIVPGRFDKNPNSPLESILSKEAETAPLTRALRGQEGVESSGTDFRGTPVISATRYIPEVDWGIGVKVDKAEVLEPLYRLRSIAVSTVIILFFACVITSLYTYRLMRRKVMYEKCDMCRLEK